MNEILTNAIGDGIKAVVNAIASVMGKTRVSCKIGDYRLLSVAPGWLFVGRVSYQDHRVLILDPACWVESPGEPITTAVHKPLNGSHIFRGGLSISQDAIIADASASPESIARLVTQPIRDV